MDVEVKPIVKGVEELRNLLEDAREQTIQLQHTLEKISETKIEIEFKSGIFSKN